MSEQMPFNRCKRWLLCTLLLLRKMYFRRSRWIRLDKEGSSVPAWSDKNERTAPYPLCSLEIDLHAAPLTLPVHRQTDMNRIRSVKEF